MARDEVLTLRLTADELGLLVALRQIGHSPYSQADIVFWALEDMCKRIVAGQDCNFNLNPQARQLCQQALDRYYARRRISYRGRRPQLTDRDRRLGSSAPDQPGEG